MGQDVDYSGSAASLVYSPWASSVFGSFRAGQKKAKEDSRPQGLLFVSPLSLHSWNDGCINVWCTFF